MHELRSLGIEAHAIFLDGGNGERLFSDLGDGVSICRQAAEVENKISELKPDFLISLDTPGICDYLDCCPEHTRFVFESHSTYPATLKRLKHISRHRVSALLTPSRAQRDLVMSVLGRRLNCPVEVVPNPLRQSATVNLDSPKYHRPIVLWVGRLDPHKNWRQYIEICRKLNASGAQMEYWMVGSTNTMSFEKRWLWEEIKEAQLSGCFRWLPYVQYENMDRLFRFVAASGGCLVSTSRLESFGMVAAEAMAGCCPVVVPDVGGFRDFVIRGETGFRYAPGETNEAVNYIFKLVHDVPNRRRIVAAGHQRINHEYAPRTAVLKLVDTLQSLTTRKTHAYSRESARPIGKDVIVQGARSAAKLRVLLTFGTRPEAIKMAPVVHQCRRQSEQIEAIVCVTGQHREMLDQVIRYFDIAIDRDLELMVPNQTLADVASRCLTGLDAAIAEYRPDCVVAQGDTITVMAASLAAFFRRVPFVHVEAGFGTWALLAPLAGEVDHPGCPARGAF